MYQENLDMRANYDITASRKFIIVLVVTLIGLFLEHLFNIDLMISSRMVGSHDH
jgi:hypothetical protein